MKKYRGEYRVACEFDMITEKPNKDDVFIVCYDGGKIYRKDRDTLVYYNTKLKWSVEKKMGDQGIWFDSWLDDETEIFFKESDLDKVAAIVGVPKSGKDIAPTSKKNIRFMDWYKK